MARKPLKQNQESDSGDDSDASNHKGKRLGDKLFAEDETKLDDSQLPTSQLRQLLATLHGKKAKAKLIDEQVPELQGLLEEFEDSLVQVDQVLAPLIAKS